MRLKKGELFYAYDTVNGKLAYGAPFKVTECSIKNNRVVGIDSIRNEFNGYKGNKRIFKYSYHVSGMGKEQGWRIERCVK